MRTSIRVIIKVLMAFLACSSSVVWSLPINFYHNQGTLKYDEIESANFRVYFDRRTPREARLFLNALEAGKVPLEQWLDVQRESPLPVITTASAANASFANFITDALELQTLGRGERDLAWHELTHNIMYEHLENWLGPAGSVLHLMWMPTWFVEGLAEAMSVSEGSDVQAGLERYQALTGNWPTYERLHSLYNDPVVARRGYATSGAFVAYLLRTYPASELPKVLERFFWNSAPWWWAWASVPWGPYLPMDDALEEWTGKDGRELYEEYKEAAFKYWNTKKKGPFFSQKSGPKKSWRWLGRFEQRNNDLFYVKTRSDGRGLNHKLIFDPGTGWANASQLDTVFPEEANLNHRSVTEKFRVFSKTLDKDDRPGFVLLRREAGGKVKVIAKRRGTLAGIFQTKLHLAWIEQQTERTKLCQMPWSAVDQTHDRRKQIRCVVKISQPKLTSLLGTRRLEGSKNEAGVVDEIWIHVRLQKLVGDSHRIVVWTPDAKANPLRRISIEDGGFPHSVAQSGKDTWLLVGSRNRRHLRKINDQGVCLNQVDFEDTPEKIFGFPDGSLALGLMHPTGYSLLKINPAKLKQTVCQHLEEHHSPMLAYVRSKEPVSLQEALSESSIWSKNDESKAVKVYRKIHAAPPAHKRSDGKKVVSQPASWRPRPVFGVPWIGVDSGGYTFGLLSVPLMDEMQNETLRFTTLYGPESRFPSTSIDFQTTRYVPTINVSAFRQQVWNGPNLDRSIAVTNAYLEEIGAGVVVSRFLPVSRMLVNLTLTSSELKPYIGSPGRNVGQHTMFGLGLSKTWRIASMYWFNSLNGTAVPEFLNENFEYNTLGLSSSLSQSFAFLSSRMSLGLDLSRTRGTKTRRVREIYRPLRLFIPGDGGGINNMNFPVAGSGALFAADFGDTKARSSLLYTFPLIRNVDYLVRLFYLKRLDFSAFLNYGGAWFGDEMPDTGEFIAAHGYRSDLMFDLKGIDFSIGLGAGQVFGEDFEVFANFTFSSILDDVNN